MTFARLKKPIYNQAPSALKAIETMLKKRFAMLIILILGIIIGLPLLIWFIVTQPVFWVRQNKSVAVVDPTRLEDHVRILATVFIPRDYRHPENLDQVAAYIRQEFERTQGRVSEQTFEVEGITYRNVILQFGPETGERIVIGAHYDAFAEYAAADDNASGVAGLIELAHLLDNVSFKTPLELVAYTLEEPPYFRTENMGSAVHAQSLKDDNQSVKVMIALEMIGYFDDTPGSQQYPVAALGYLYPTQGDFIAIIGKLDGGRPVRQVKQAMVGATDLPVYSLNAPANLVAGVDFSDHRNYWHQGYPAVMVTDTAFLRNFNYHTPNDTPDTLDYDRMADVVIGVYEAILSLAQ